MTIGILAAGAYIPRLRLPRRVIAETNRWLNSALMSQAKGERAICNWDEDTVTMAVEAGRDALAGRDRDAITGLHLASTTFPFVDRLNACIAAEALSLSAGVDAVDIAGTQRAATSALRNARGGSGQTLIVAAEKRRAKAASPIEMTSGDAAAAVVVGDGEPIARLVGSATRTVDFVDHYRTMESVYDYQWEERWVRDAGYLSIVPPVIARCLESAGLTPPDVTHFCMPTALSRVANAVAKASDIPEAAIADSLHAECGDSGTTHPLIMLVAALEKAKPGERILIVGFGQGADALLFEVTAAMPKLPGRLGVPRLSRAAARGTNYAKFLAFNDNIEIERGMRAETDKLTPLSALWRNREAVTGLSAAVAGSAARCNFRRAVSASIRTATPSIPRTVIRLPTRSAASTPITADRLTYSPDPPACYGMIALRRRRALDDGFHRCRGRQSTSACPCAWCSGSRTIDAAARLPPLLLESRAARSRRERSDGKRDSRQSRHSRHGLLEVRRAVGHRRRGPDGRGLRRGVAGCRDRDEADRCRLARRPLSRSNMSASRPCRSRSRSACRSFPVTRVENYCASGTEAFRGAVYAVAAGRVRHRACAGRRKAEGHGLWRAAAAQARHGQRHDTGRTSPRPARSRSSPPPTARSTASRRDDLKRAMAHISVKSHDNGARNPKAHLRNRITIETVLNAPIVAEPLGLYDCCGVSDGAACAIVTTPEIARALGKPDLIAVKALQLAVSNGVEAQHNSWDGSYFAHDAHRRTARLRGGGHRRTRARRST